MRYDITTFGARPTAGILNTDAIQAAINACADAGGGQVYIPPGRFTSGALRFRSRVTLHLSQGATLLADGNISHYSSDVHKNMLANEAHMDRCFIFASDAEDIGVTGPGQIDGQGDLFPNASDTARHRPMLLRFLNCRNVLFRDITLQNPASWACAILYSSNVHFDNLRIDSRRSPNGVALALDGCRDVRISNCTFDAGDDALCLQASRTDRTCQGLSIANCQFSGRGAGVRVGLLSAGVIRDIALSNCIFRDIADAALKVQANEGGIIENLRLSNLVMREVSRIAFITLNRHRVGTDTPAGIQPMGALRNISISGLVSQTLHADDRKAAIIIVGAPDGKIEDISLDDLDLTLPGGGEAWTSRLVDVRELGTSRPEHRALGGSLPAYGLYARHVRGLRLGSMRLRLDLPDPRPAQALDDVTLHQ